ncbi:MAG: chemotaxis protein CheW [Peptostreptococcaceae bacterium]|jgi:chemotaxis signal transduction protein|nr:chemotaxis protein CheW [Peptostreptococcaceae bacterium]
MKYKISNKMYAIELSKVKQVLRVKDLKIQQIKRTRRSLSGIFSLRGEIIPLLDLTYIIFEQEEDISKKKVMVMNVKGNKIGFIIDEVEGKVKIEEDTELKKIDDAKYIDYIFNIENTNIKILNINSLVNI